MEPMWTIITIISSTVFASGTVIGIYYTHKNKAENRIKELEDKIKHHEKFIKILENKALKALEEQFDKK